MPSSLQPPFPALFVSVVGNDKRVYTTQAQARSFISGNYNTAIFQAQGRKVFKKACSLWVLSEGGWQLLFAAEEGEDHASIPWKKKP